MKNEVNRALGAKKTKFLTLATCALLLLAAGCKNNEPQQQQTPVTIDVRADGATLQFNIDGEQQTVNTKDVTQQHMPAAVRLILAGKRE